MKVLTSPVKKWPGTITIPDYLTIPQAMAWEEAINNASSILPEKTESNLGERVNKSFTSEWASLIIPGIKSCVLEWNLENFDPDNFPATPKLSRIQLLSWIMSEITNLYKEADEIPNA